MATNVAVVDVQYIMSASKMPAAKVEEWHTNEAYSGKPDQ